MDSLPRAVSLSRALLSLARARADGVLHIKAARGTCRLALLEGVAGAAEGELGSGRSLGDELLAMGALDAAAHRRALDADALDASIPAGAWLVRLGLVEAAAVERALRRQLCSRLLAALRCRDVDYRFEPGAQWSGAPRLQRPPAPADLVLGALRRRVADHSTAELLRAVDAGTLTLSGLGQRLLREARLRSEEVALGSLLREGAELSAILRELGGSRPTLIALATWSLLGAVVPREAPRDGRYGLLLRKARQLRRQDSAHVLLDMPADGSPAAARRALRQLVTRVHPDTLGTACRPELRSACNEVLGGLLEAERQLREQARR